MAEPKAVSLPKSRTTTPKNKAITPKNGVTPRNMFSPKLVAPNDDKLFVGSPHSGLGERFVSKSILKLKNRFTKNERDMHDHLYSSAKLKHDTSNNDNKRKRKDSDSQASSYVDGVPNDDNNGGRSRGGSFLSIKSNAKKVVDRVLNDAKFYLNPNINSTITNDSDQKGYMPDRSQNTSITNSNDNGRRRKSSGNPNGNPNQYPYPMNMHPYYNPYQMQYMYQYPPYMQPQQYFQQFYQQYGYYPPPIPIKPWKSPNKRRGSKNKNDEPVIIYKRDRSNSNSSEGLHGLTLKNGNGNGNGNNRPKRNSLKSPIKYMNPGQSPIAAIKEDIEIKLDLDTPKSDINDVLNRDKKGQLSDIIEREVEVENSFETHDTHSIFDWEYEQKNVGNIKLDSMQSHNSHNGHHGHHHGKHRHHHHGKPLTPHHIKFGLTQDWETHTAEKSANWYELFTDLIYVTVIIKMTGMFAYLWKKYKKPESMVFIIIEVFIYHFAFYVTWLEMAVVQTRFVSKKRIYIIMKYLYFTGVVSMAMCCIEERPSKNSFQFILGLLMVFITHLGIHFHLCTIPRASLYCLVNIIIVIISISILLIGVFVNNKNDDINNSIRMICIFIAILFVYFRTATTFTVDPNQIPVNVHHFAERFGLFMMLYIGETIISILTSEYKFEPKYYYLIHLGFLNVYIIRIIYYNLAFEESKHRGDTHALRNAESPGPKWFVASHIFLAFGLIGEALGLKLMLKDIKSGYQINNRNAYFWVYAHVFTQLCVLMIRQTHQKVRDTILGYIHLFLRFILTCVTFPFIPRISDVILEFATLMVLFTLFFAVFDVILIKYIKKITAKHESKAVDFGETMKQFRKSQMELNPEIAKEMKLKSQQQKSIRDITKVLAKQSTTRKLTVNIEDIKSNKDIKRHSSHHSRHDSQHKRHDSLHKRHSQHKKHDTKHEIVKKDSIHDRKSSKHSRKSSKHIRHSSKHSSIKQDKSGSINESKHEVLNDNDADSNEGRSTTNINLETNSNNSNDSNDNNDSNDIQPGSPPASKNKNNKLNTPNNNNSMNSSNNNDSNNNDKSNGDGSDHSLGTTPGPETESNPMINE